MKIVFLCGSLEPGRNGVGDYVRRLGTELIRNGYEAYGVALNDHEVPAAIMEKQVLEGIEFPVFRLAASCPLRNRIFQVRDWIHSINPEWISLQYVPYSFQLKGLPFGLARYLKQLGGARKWHIMFHELWIDITKVSAVKHRLIGHFQRKILESIVKELHPKLVTTTNSLYQSVLLKHRIGAFILPLFSNIPLSPPDYKFLDCIYKKLSIKEEDRNRNMIIGLFGNIHKDAKLETVLWNQLCLAEIEGRKLVVIGFGHTENCGLNKFQHLASTFKGRIEFLHLGSLPTLYVSSLLQILDAGISCTPIQYIGKSGVFAAMRLHNLEVILPNNESMPEYRAQIGKYYLELCNKFSEEWDVSFISHQFLELLSN